MTTPLLTTSNTKILKGEKKGYRTFLLHLAPAKVSGYQVCPMATAGCESACLFTAGMGVFPKVQEARIRKTVDFFEHRDAFMSQLVKEVKAAIKSAERAKMIPVFRPNGTSDIRWENIAVGGYENIMAMFPNVQFYDYTKIPNRRNLPANYHLTFSLAESNRSDAVTALANGMNVAAVFRTLPETFMGHDVINGDEDDLRFLDPSPCIVGLKAKGRAKKDTSGFVQN
jgi:hypothetical protein